MFDRRKVRRNWFITHEWINYRSNSIARKGGPIYRDSFRKGERSYSSSVRKDRRRPHKSVRKAMLTTNLLFTQTFHKVRVSFCANSWRSFSVRFPRRLVVAGGSEVRDEGAQPENLWKSEETPFRLQFRAVSIAFDQNAGNYGRHSIGTSYSSPVGHGFSSMFWYCPNIFRRGFVCPSVRPSVLGSLLQCFRFLTL